MILCLSSILVIIAIFTIFNGKNQINDSKKEENIIYAHADLVVNPNDIEKYIGYMDYVFIGEVKEHIGNYIIDNNQIPENKYKILVKENLKGKLVDEIIVTKLGGYTKDGKLMLLDCDTEEDFLPEVGKQYIFMAMGQSNGNLILSSAKGNVKYTEDLRKNYVNYIANEIVYERPRSISKYDKSLK